jgi:hypothetical protein
VEPEFQQWQSEQQQQQEQHELRASGAGFLMRAHDLALGLGELELVYPTPGVDLADLLGAYYGCRRNKRNTMNALSFELDYELELLALRDEINSGTYQPRPSIAFVVDKPVQREIFAADFRDRVVHHLIINKLNSLFERKFIYDSYACRVGKGTLFGIRRLDTFIRRCSVNYTRDCYVLKLDIKGFFMHINARKLLLRLNSFVDEQYKGLDVVVLKNLCEIVLMNKPSENCVIKGKPSDWDGLPKDKSLFHSPPDCGLPIGNLSSQVFANFYLDIFDHFVKHDLGMKYYGRYVDDFVLVHESREYLAALIPVIRNFLADELELQLHPKKIYLQHYSHGVHYLGAVIKPGRIYVGKRTKGNFYNAIMRHNAVVAGHLPSTAERQAFRASINSYLGVMGHFDTRRLRRSMVGEYVRDWWKYAHTNGDVSKIVLRPNVGVSSVE